MKILFMCVANSARSQLAEGIAKHLLGDSAEIESAGSMPKDVNPLAVRALEEVGIDIKSAHSKSVKDLNHLFLAGLDYLITLCAEEVCPVLPSQTAKRLHWPLQDPAGHEGNDDAQMERFRFTRDLIRERLEEFKLTLQV